MNTQQATRMKVKEIVDKIQSFGYRVKITHYRFFGNRLLRNADIRVLIKAMKIMGDEGGHNLISNMGGLTEVEVTKGDVGFKSEAACSVRDPFVYNKAGRLALFRALQALQEPELQELRKEIGKMYLKYTIQIKDNNKWADYDNPDYPSVEDKDIAEDQAKQVAHDTGKETRVIEVFE